jgi:hypothetical protein
MQRSCSPPIRVGRKRLRVAAHLREGIDPDNKMSQTPSAGPSVHRCAPLGTLLLRRGRFTEGSGGQHACPFVDLPGEYVIKGSQYDPHGARGQVADPDRRLAGRPGRPGGEGIDGSANTITAALCDLTTGQPASVCGRPSSRTSRHNSMAVNTDAGAGFGVTERGRQPPTWATPLTLLLCLAGLRVSLYLTIAHYNANTVLPCPDTGVVNCVQVTTSPAVGALWRHPSGVARPAVLRRDVGSVHSLGVAQRRTGCALGQTERCRRRDGHGGLSRLRRVPLAGCAPPVVRCCARRDIPALRRPTHADTLSAPPAANEREQH